VKLSQRRLARPSLGGLMATRQGALMLALICAVCAAGILVFALGRYKTSVQTPIPQATVLVATGQIQQGSSGNAIAAEGLFKSTPIVATQLSPGAISNSAQLAGKTVAADILPGQQLTLSDFATTSGVTGVLSPNQRAVSVSIDEAHGDTDVLQSGDRVDLYSTFTINSKLIMVLLVPNALVLKPASSAPGSSGGQTITGGSLVLVVSAGQAASVGFAADNGKLFVALRPPNASATPSAPTTLGSILAAAPTTTSTSAGSHSSSSSNPSSPASTSTTTANSTTTGTSTTAGASTTTGSHP
jgi:Flp pilus assembly protein CpaB